MSVILRPEFPDKPHRCGAAFQITPEAVSYPFIYSADDRIDLGRMLERHHPDPADRLGSWARGFMRSKSDQYVSFAGRPQQRCRGMDFHIRGGKPIPPM
jgi:hypothetical protein